MYQLLITFDHEVFLFINHLPHTPVSDVIALTLSGVLASTVIVWLLLSVWLFVREQKRDHWFFLPVVLASTLSILVTDVILKNFFSRNRPPVSLGTINIGGPLADYSFPSGHATFAWALAIVLAAKEPRAKWLFYGLAFLISLSRVYLGQHYPSDVTAGTLLGVAIGVLVVQKYKHLFRNQKTISEISETFNGPQTSLHVITKRNILHVTYKIFLAVISTTLTCIALWLVLDLYLIRIQYKPQRLNWTWIIGLEENNKQFTYSHDDEFIPDANLIYRSKPDISGFTDQFGFRLNPNNHENLLKTKKKIILALGDSTTWGIVANDETFPYYLSQNMNDYYVINAGTQSYGPDQEYVLFRDMILRQNKIKPSIVIWTLYLNDMSDMVTFPLFVINHNHLIQIPGWINGVYLVHSLLKYSPDWLINSCVGNYLLALIQNINIVRIMYNTPIKENAFVTEKFRLIIRDMEALCKSNSIQLVVVLAPSQGFLTGQVSLVYLYKEITQILDNSVISYLDMNNYFKPNKISTVLGASVEQQGIPQATSSSELFNTDVQESGGPYDWKHTSATGNKAFADIVHSYLEQSSNNY